MSTQITYENDHHSLFCDSTISVTLNFCFLYILLKSKRKYHIRRNINSKEKKCLYVKSILLLFWFAEN